MIVKTHYPVIFRGRLINAGVEFEATAREVDKLGLTEVERGKVGLGDKART